MKSQPFLTPATLRNAAFCLFPIASFLFFLRFLGQVKPALVWHLPWITGLGVNLSWRIDSLSLLFALLICGIGAFVFIYATSYFAKPQELTKFLSLTSLFMVAMLGLVLSENIIALFCFWELTTLTSYFLIGFHPEDKEARKQAWAAMAITGGGGLLMLVGFLLLGQWAGSFDLSVLLQEAGTIKNQPAFPIALACLVLGAMTKSAQFPFHGWLLGAMVAPTPISTYLHSATMVKAGIYLLARFYPVLGTHPYWSAWLCPIGWFTFAWAGFSALNFDDLKKALAYSTVSALGLMVALMGHGHLLSLHAAMAVLVAHALYKAALFMVTGAIDHGLHTRDLTKLSGIRRKMPFIALGATLAAFSMAGLPPTLGFLAKELSLDTVLLDIGPWRWMYFALAAIGTVSTVALATRILYPTFFGPGKTPRTPREESASMWWPILFLSLLGWLTGAVATRFGAAFLSPAAQAIFGVTAIFPLSLFHGVNFTLIVSLILIAVGILLGLLHSHLSFLFNTWKWVFRVEAPQVFFYFFEGLLATARAATRILESGFLRRYVLVFVAFGMGLVFWQAMRSELWLYFGEESLPATLSEKALFVFILGCAILSLWTRSRIVLVAALGGVGYGIAMLYALLGAPDLALTQFAVESLSVILFAWLLVHLPPLKRKSTRLQKALPITVAVFSGSLVSLLTWAAISTPAPSRLTPFFNAESFLGAHGRNVVNVILVDFRGFDTLGEITVLAIATIAIVGLWRSKPKAIK